jgi:hypothetical protein
LEPIIIVYTREEAKRPYDSFDDFIVASFHIGMEYREPEGKGNVKSVRIEVYSAGDLEGLDDLKTFVSLLLDRGIDHETKFFSEPTPSEGSTDSRMPPPPLVGETLPSKPGEPHLTGYETEIRKLRDMRQKGALSERQYEAQKQALLKRWRKQVDEGLSR